jgi:hypothetical protein
MVMEPCVSVAAGIGVDVSTGIGVGTAVWVGLAISTYAHRFSSVGVGEANKLPIEALAGDVPLKKTIMPMPVHNRISHRLATSRMRLVGRRALMGSYY